MTDRLLDALSMAHGAPQRPPEPPVQLQPLPPIPNRAIAEAADIAFSAFAIGGKIRAIQRAVADEYAPVTLGDMLSPRRTAKVVEARHVAIYLAKKLTEHSLPEIGRRFGDRNHTTILHAVRRIDKLVSKNAEFASRVRLIESLIWVPVQ